VRVARSVLPWLCLVVILAACSATDASRCAIYAAKPITNQRILPAAAPPPGTPDVELEVVAAKGEFEPATFVVRPEFDLRRLSISVSPLKGLAGKLPASVVDVRAVKVWYQDQGLNYKEKTPPHNYNPVHLTGVKSLIPELLLYDDSLVKVDYDKQLNLLKTSRGYVDITRTESPRVATREEFLFADAATLQPVDIPAGNSKQFWVTVHVPDDAAAGDYSGMITLKSANGREGQVKIKLRVLPFTLPKPGYISSMYYNAPNHVFYNTNDLLLRQFEKEMRNMREHGVYNAMFPFEILKMERDVFVETLRIRERLGISNKQILFHGFIPDNLTGIPPRPGSLEKLREKIAECMQVFRACGAEDVYFYGRDEAKDDMVRDQRPIWEAVHEAGGKVFVAGYYQRGQFDLVGHILDLFVSSGYPVKEEAARWHGAGRKIIAYGSPQGGVEAPETYRRNFGLLIWQNDFDGHGTYVYHGGANRQGGYRHLVIPGVWNDFATDVGQGWKGHNMAYPTADGVIDTVQWEGFREGVDDVRYLTLLLDLMKQAEASGECGRGVRRPAPLAAARQFIDELKATDINATDRDLDEVRSEMVRHILALQDGP